MPLFKYSLRLVLWIFGTVSGICLAQNLLPNPKFEEGQNQPTGWKLVGSNGRRLPDARENQSALMVQGNGKSLTFWRTEPIALQPNSLYRLNFTGRWERANTEGSAVAGPNTINRDFQLTWSWARYSYGSNFQHSFFPAMNCSFVWYAAEPTRISRSIPSSMNPA